MDATKPTVVFVGDSITEQGGNRGGFVRVLARDLVPCRVINAGVSGNRSGDVLARLEKDALAWEPSLVVVMVGINDVWHRSAQGFRAGHLAEFARHLQQVAEQVVRAGVPLVLCTTTVIGEDPTSPENSALKALNQEIRELGTSAGVPVADVNLAFGAALQRADGVSLTVDGVHLSRAGNALVAEVLLPVLRGALATSGGKHHE